MIDRRLVDDVNLPACDQRAQHAAGKCVDIEFRRDAAVEADEMRLEGERMGE